MLNNVSIVVGQDQIPWYKSIEDARKNYLSKISIDFDDIEGFKIVGIDLDITSFTKIVDENEVPQAYEVKGSKPINKEDYGFIESWSLTWNF